MARSARQIIDTTINLKAKDNPMLARIILAKLVLKGIDPNRLTPESDYDPTVIERLESVLKEFK